MSLDFFGVEKRWEGKMSCPLTAPPSPSPTTISHYHPVLLWQSAMLVDWVKAIKGHLFLTFSVLLPHLQSLSFFPSPIFFLPHSQPSTLPPPLSSDICLSYSKSLSSLFFLSLSLLSSPLCLLLPFILAPSLPPSLHLSLPPSSSPFQFFIQLKDPSFKNSSHIKYVGYIMAAGYLGDWTGKGDQYFQCGSNIDREVE